MKTIAVMAFELKRNTRVTWETQLTTLLLFFLYIHSLRFVSCQVSYNGHNFVEPSPFVNRSLPVVDKVCSSKTTCSECITAEPQCVWCKTKDNGLDHELRCGTLDTMTHCPRDDIVNPKNAFTMNRSRSLSRPKANVEDIVQLWPQKVTLKTRINSPNRFKVKFRQAEDYPVDLYFLMDLSYSMLDDKRKLANLGNLLGAAMGEITTNFRLGFGSFVDKKVAPYVSVVPRLLREPCPGCAAPYGFINHMPLDNDAQRFASEVERTPISANIDAPEGVFDAMMQAIVCHKEIGWRNVSRKILLVATDASFHCAGDGKLGGIITPNDKLCHLDRNGVYTESTTMDYPSVGQINSKVVENNINVLFAATSNVVHVYKELQRRITGSYTGQLATNSENILDLVKEQYEKISTTVELKDNAPNNVHVSYYSNCLHASNSMEQTNVCRDLKVGKEVEFDVEVEVLKCPVNAKDRKTQFKISPVGLSDILEVNLDIICECDCESGLEQEVNSESCSSVGTYQCGVCSCPPHKSGPFCQCDGNRVTNETEEALCTQDSSSVICSGRGSCICGQCDCISPSLDRRIYGRFCECDNYSCLYSNGRVCGGPDRGTCECGQCKCFPGWSGEACDCKTSDESCATTTGDICSNHGVCECGHCKCDSAFAGQNCEYSISPEGRCSMYRVCAHCFAFPDQSTQLNCAGCTHNFEVVDEAKVRNVNEHLCQSTADDGCYFYFVYDASTDAANMTSSIRVQKTKECPKPVNVLVIVAAVIGAIVAIGLGLLILWKIITTIYDRRTYAKFLEDLEKTKWGIAMNPMYKPSTSTFANPTYIKDQ